MVCIIFFTCHNTETTCHCLVDTWSIYIVTYLGATLDQSMSGEYMGQNVVKKVNTRLKFLYRSSSYLNAKVRKLLASALIQAHFDSVQTFGTEGSVSKN